MKASEARRLSSNERNVKSENDLEKVYKQINSAVKMGDFAIWHYGRLSPEEKNELIRQGYALENITDPRDNAPTYKIQW